MSHLSRGNASRVSMFLLIAFTYFSPLMTYAEAASRSTPSRPLRILVLGDSVIWGQGLSDQNKFTVKLANWLCEQRTGGKCVNSQAVQLHVEAHSGAVISRPRTTREREAEEQFTRSVWPSKYAGEVNNGYPTLWGQVELAKRYYQSHSIPLDEVDIVLINGGINDLNATNLLLPSPIGGDIKQPAREYCQEEMKSFSVQVADSFPNARIIVPGYFPLVSECTPPDILLTTLREWLFEKKWKQKIVVKLLQEDLSQSSGGQKPCEPTRTVKRLAERSSEFVTACNNGFREAVKYVNGQGQPLQVTAANGEKPPAEASARAIFVPIPYKDENAYGAPNTFLWKLGRKDPSLQLNCAADNLITRLVVNDEMQRDRACMCTHAGKPKDVICFRAGTFHPNKEGANLYFESIRKKLEGIVSFVGWRANP